MKNPQRTVADQFNELERRVRTLETTQRVPQISSLRIPVDTYIRPFVASPPSSPKSLWLTDPVPASSYGFAISFGLDLEGGLIGDGEPLDLNLIVYSSTTETYTETFNTVSVYPKFVTGKFELPEGSRGQQLQIALTSFNHNSSAIWNVYKPSVSFVNEASSPDWGTFNY